jgi:alpha-galactosidase
MMSKKIVLIGAGSAMFGLGTVGDIFHSQVLQGSHIVLHDINPTTLDHVLRVAETTRQERGLAFTVSATTNRREALAGADFCVISIEVGNRFELWEQDWQLPLLHGFKQIYGENGGPGGLFHSLRIIPPILDICHDINNLCPQATVFNFSNPMTRICLAIQRKFPALRVVGLCHEIASLPLHLPKILETPLDNIDFTAAGLNHFSVLLAVNYRDSGADAYPDVRAKAPAYFKDSPSVADIFIQEFGGADAPPPPRPWAGRQLFREILTRYGYLPITDDSHFGEYIQWAYEVADHQGIREFYEAYKRWSLETVPEDRIGGTEPGEMWSIVPLMESIATGTARHEPAVNIMNRGYIDNLPADMVVEVPATVDGNGVHGIRLGSLPRSISALLNNQVATIDLTVEAAIYGELELARQALLADPIVDSVQRAELLLEDMLSLQQPYLGYLV